MKDGKRLYGEAVKFLIALIVIIGFIRGDVQAVFYALWLFALTAWIFKTFAFPALKSHFENLRTWYYTVKTTGKEKKTQAKTLAPKLSETQIDRNLFIMHVNQRITDYLKIRFPEVSWRWCEKNPEVQIIACGVNRIRILNNTDYTHAEIRFDRCANLHCELLKITPFTETVVENTNNIPEESETEPRVWFEKNGKAAINKIIKDFQSRGHNSMTITENGDCLVIHGNNALKYSTIADMPKKTLWTALIDVLESEGIAAKIGVYGLDVAW